MSKPNYIINACCSVDDLRSHLRNLNPETLEKKRELQNYITEAIQHETLNGGRVTINKMLQAKWNAIQKLIPALLLVLTLTSCSRSIVVWKGTDLIGFGILGVAIFAWLTIIIIDKVCTWLRKRFKKS
jgi:small-conductance mechanosensitive channel